VLDLGLLMAAVLDLVTELRSMVGTAGRARLVDDRSRRSPPAGAQAYLLEVGIAQCHHGVNASGRRRYATRQWRLSPPARVPGTDNTPRELSRRGQVLQLVADGPSTRRSATL